LTVRKGTFSYIRDSKCAVKGRVKTLDEVYVIMWFDRISENTFYTDENRVAERVEKLNTILNNGYWYKTLTKN
jgi:hypothetical protein